ncbi:MAG: hypothetical protein ACI92E_001911 [Oceanicoccus sp.]|jgi:uncharacterized protein involved in cysteine biosynthesis
MKLNEQMSHAFIRAPLSLALMSRLSGMWLVIYFSCGLVIFSAMSWFLLQNQESIKLLVLDYFFPQSWHRVSESLGLFFFESQAKVVLGNLIISGSLVIASIFLFPIKEKYSAKFEKDAAYNNGISQEFSLPRQALEEAKLFILFLTVQSVILWIGYYPYTWTTKLSVLLSYVALFFTFGLDFISPTLQRHKTSYALILKVLLKNSIAVLCFGLLYSLPVVIFSQVIFRNEELTLIEISTLVFFANILFLTLAVPAGTHLASMLLPEVRRTKEPTKNTRQWVYSTSVVTLLIMLFLHGGLIASLHHKSQLLKANYTIDWSSFDVNLPSFGEFFKGNALTSVSFDVKIGNPTQFDIVIDNSQIVVEKQELSIAIIDLAGFEIPSDSSHIVTVKLDSNSDLSKIENFDNLLENWRVDFRFELWPGIPFVINVTE